MSFGWSPNLSGGLWQGCSNPGGNSCSNPSASGDGSASDGISQAQPLCSPPPAGQMPPPPQNNTGLDTEIILADNATGLGVGGLAIGCVETGVTFIVPNCTGTTGAAFFPLPGVQSGDVYHYSTPGGTGALCTTGLSYQYCPKSLAVGYYLNPNWLYLDKAPC